MTKTQLENWRFPFNFKMHLKTFKKHKDHCDMVSEHCVFQILSVGNDMNFRLWKWKQWARSLNGRRVVLKKDLPAWWEHFTRWRGWEPHFPSAGWFSVSMSTSPYRFLLSIFMPCRENDTGQVSAIHQSLGHCKNLVSLWNCFWTVNMPCMASILITVISKKTPSKQGEI